MARAAGHPAIAGQGRRVDQWQQINPPFPYLKAKIHTAHRGQWRSNSRDDKRVTQSFRGEFNQKIDGKGRMSIPADFRRVLEAGDPEFPEKRATPRMVLLYGPHLKNCLHAYTIEEMAVVETGINKLPRGSVERKQASRMILGKSWETEVDRDGRIVLPQARREQIVLNEKGDLVVMAAMGNYFEIWKDDTYTDIETSESDDYLAGLPDDFDPMSLVDAAGQDSAGGA